MQTETKISLLSATIDHMRDLLDKGGHPAHLDMSGWGTFYQDGYGQHLSAVNDTVLDEEWNAPTCDTVGCFAGWLFINPDVRKDMKKYGYKHPSEVGDWLAHNSVHNDAYFGLYGQLFDAGLSADYWDEDEHELDRDGLLDHLAMAVVKAGKQLLESERHEATA